MSRIDAIASLGLFGGPPSTGGGTPSLIAGVLEETVTRQTIEDSLSAVSVVEDSIDTITVSDETDETDTIESASLVGSVDDALD